MRAQMRTLALLGATLALLAPAAQAAPRATVAASASNFAAATLSVDRGGTLTVTGYRLQVRA